MQVCCWGCTFCCYASQLLHAGWLSYLLSSPQGSRLSSHHQGRRPSWPPQSRPAPGSKSIVIRLRNCPFSTLLHALLILPHKVTASTNFACRWYLILGFVVEVKQHEPGSKLYSRMQQHVVSQNTSHRHVMSYHVMKIIDCELASIFPSSKHLSSEAVQ